MEMSEAKHRILFEALKLFSRNGYEATSIEHITNAVGIRKASFYSHFTSKQELLDILTDEITKRYNAYSEYVQKDLEKAGLNPKISMQQLTETVLLFVSRQFEIHTTDSFFCMARNFLTIEQFRNPQLACLLNKCQYIDVLNYYRNLLQHLIENKILIDKGIEIMVYEFYSPIVVQFYHIQRNPECKAEVLKIIETHISHFVTLYSNKGESHI